MLIYKRFTISTVFKAKIEQQFFGIVYIRPHRTITFHVHTFIRLSGALGTLTLRNAQGFHSPLGSLKTKISGELVFNHLLTRTGVYELPVTTTFLRMTDHRVTWPPERSKEKPQDECHQHGKGHVTSVATIYHDIDITPFLRSWL